MDETFSKLYLSTGRPSIPPEQLLNALFLQILYTIRSEGQLIEHLHYNFLYRWFVGLSGNGRVWEESVFTKNRKRLLDGEIANEFFAKVIGIAESEKLVSKEHFSVDGALIEAWASLTVSGKKILPLRLGVEFNWSIPLVDGLQKSYPGITYDFNKSNRSMANLKVQFYF